MSQWAREHPEAMSHIAAAPLPRQNALLADAQRHYGGELDKADTPAPPIIDRSDARAQIEQLDAELAQEQATDWELRERERGIDILERLDHTAEDFDPDDIEEEL